MNNDNIKQVIDACDDAIDVSNFVIDQVSKVVDSKYLNDKDRTELNRASSDVMDCKARALELKNSTNGVKVTPDNVMSILAMYTDAMSLVSTAKSYNDLTVSIVTAAKSRK